MVTRELATRALASAVDFDVLDASQLHCAACHSALGTRRADGSVALRFRGATVIVREGAVVCGVCGHNESVCSPAVTVDFELTGELWGLSQ